MKKDVSCKAFEIFFKPLAAKKIELSDMLAGTALTPELVRNKDERVTWPDFVTVMNNLRPHFTDEEYVELGRSHLRGPVLRFIFVVARLRFTPMGFYRWFNKPREGAGNQLFSCIQPELKDISSDELQLDLVVPEGYDVCWDFFTVTRGNLEEMPRLLGYPAAKVEQVRIQRGARFNIRVPVKTSLFTHVKRAVYWPFTARAAALQLKEAHETLRERYDDIEDARAKLDRQATRLRTAHTISQLIHGDLDLARTLETITKALVEEAEFSHAELVVPDASAAAFGTKSNDPELVRSLQARSGDIGVLRVQSKVSADHAEREELLAFIEPTLAMAIQNAVAYRELAEYKAGLEKIVDQRTAELRVAHDKLADLVDLLRAAQDAREKFFSNISHEIRTPLSLILLATSDVEKRAGHLLDERSQNGLGSVTDSARKLVRLVDELLLLAAGQAHKLVLNPEPTDVAALCSQVVAAWRPAAEANGLTLQTRSPVSLFASVDPVAIERVASNLLSNAVKYTPRGGRIELELEHTPEGLCLFVRDTGPGIEPELAGRLFGRFERAVGEDRRKAGTGIGLALVKQLVEGHGGTVSALDRSTGGTEFRVVLPGEVVISDLTAASKTTLRVMHAPAAPAIDISSGMVVAPSGVSAGTILIAEDEPRLAKSIADLLSQHYTVIVALDGLAALELVQRHQPQLLITDVDMPGMNGIDLSRRFREMTGDRLAPIVILSAVIDLRTRVAGLEAGAVDYVGKPFDPAELKARVDAQFRMRDLAMRLHRAEQLSAMGILTSGLAHELRNPANGIVNAMEPLIELLPSELQGSESPVGQLLEVMKSCADQIAFLTRQLLGFRSNAELDLRPADMPQLVQRAVKLASVALTGLDLRTNLDFEGPVLCAAPLLLQVLTNLIENAAHAAGKGGWVEVNGHRDGERIAIEIMDSGPGVSVELRERVFEPFFTTKPPGSGTGLGLSVARTIVHRHHGTLEIRPLGAGSAFVIELPAESNHVAASKAV